MSNTKLNYAVIPNPNPLMVGSTAASIQVVGTNPNDFAVEINAIQVTLPAGSEGASLITSIDGVTVSPTKNEAQHGVVLNKNTQNTFGFIAKKDDPNTFKLIKVEAGGTVAFTFSNLTISSVKGTSEVTVREITAAAPSGLEKKLKVVKAEAGWFEPQLWASDTTVFGNESVMLHWTGPKGATYSLKYFDKSQNADINLHLDAKPNGIANHGVYPNRQLASPQPLLPLNEDATFTLNVSWTNPTTQEVKTDQSQVHIAFKQPKPAIRALVVTPSSFEAGSDRSYTAKVHGVVDNVEDGRVDYTTKAGKSQSPFNTEFKTGQPVPLVLNEITAPQTITLVGEGKNDQSAKHTFPITTHSKVASYLGMIKGVTANYDPKYRFNFRFTSDNKLIVQPKNSTFDGSLKIFDLPAILPTLTPDNAYSSNSYYYFEDGSAGGMSFSCSTLITPDGKHVIGAKIGKNFINNVTSWDLDTTMPGYTSTFKGTILSEDRNGYWRTTGFKAAGVVSPDGKTAIFPFEHYTIPVDLANRNITGWNWERNQMNSGVFTPGDFYRFAADNSFVACVKYDTTNPNNQGLPPYDITVIEMDQMINNPSTLTPSVLYRRPAWGSAQDGWSSQAYDLALTPDMQEILVHRGDAILVLDASRPFKTNQTPHKIPVPNKDGIQSYSNSSPAVEPFVKITPDGSKAFILTGKFEIGVIDLTKNQADRSVVKLKLDQLKEIYDNTTLEIDPQGNMAAVTYQTTKQGTKYTNWCLALIDLTLPIDEMIKSENIYFVHATEKTKLTYKPQIVFNPDSSALFVTTDDGLAVYTLAPKNQLHSDGSWNNSISSGQCLISSDGKARAILDHSQLEIVGVDSTWHPWWVSGHSRNSHKKLTLTLTNQGELVLTEEGNTNPLWTNGYKGPAGSYIALLQGYKRGGDLKVYKVNLDGTRQLAWRAGLGGADNV